MATIKKAQGGFTLSEAKRKRDSLDYDAKTSMAAARQRTLGSKGYDNISQELTKRASRSDSLKNVFDKAIERATKKAAPKQRNGGKTSIKKAQGGKKVRLKEDSRAYITKIKTDDEGNVASLKSRRTVKGLLSGAPRAKKIMKSGGKVVKKSTSKSKKK